MNRLYAIGEVLIDFIPLQKGCALKDVTAFERAPGGAPANVAAAAAKYGAPSSLLTKLGRDAFGDFLLEELERAGVDTAHIPRTNDANTGLAFVSLKENGERDFSFYRNPSADLLLSEEEIDPALFKAGDILHFGSVNLVDSPMKQAHRKAIRAVKAAGGLVSFDPNVRLPLWDDADSCRRAILEFLPKADLVKISDEELEFVTGIADPETALHSLLRGDVKAVVYTRGGDGAELYTANGRCVSPGYKVDVQDTTGAGDAFVGGFLFHLLKQGASPDNLTAVLEQHHGEMLRFANASGALTTTKKGAISALPTIEDIQKLMDSQHAPA
ncbi:carbohydrate kinase family protein [Saccharibacillus alkalitolerans]|uniref:Carbohydrate kinase n=1 Tax=Saccharibacillus alkalitolerans TaxID=2705290 RepID=A0ABX0F4L0_9BACL|nr:carbohydrate kinase [Saccharibacillus alkalitolerans]NGZ75901.1 carbohydrate kinase [Saccharibacillus alkalitolerans]